MVDALLWHNRVPFPMLCFAECDLGSQGHLHFELGGMQRPSASGNESLGCDVAAERPTVGALRMAGDTAGGLSKQGMSS